MHGLQVRFGYVLIQSEPIQTKYPVWLFLVWYVLRYWAWGLLAPLVAALVERVPPGPDAAASLRASLVYLGLAPVFILVHDAIAALFLSLPLVNPDGDTFAQNLRFGLGVLPVYSFLTYAALVIFFAGRHMQRALRAEEQRAALLRTTAAEAELRALQAQLEPHFLFNSLHAVSGLVLTQPKAALEMLDRIGAFLRHSLDRTPTPLHPLQEELRSLELYLAIEQVRFGERLRVRFDIDPATRDLPIPSQLLQPLVENALRHGLAPIARPGLLQVRSRRGASDWVIEIEDNGRGLAPHAKEGIGLQNTRGRLAAAGESAAQLLLAPVSGGGTQVTLRLPLPDRDAGADATTARTKQGQPPQPVWSTP
ncbi:MAG: histidine kinase [Verrucomicrobia bacterium]|nr:histidine kinase [Verrucomicrobiota bacterium]